MRPSPVTGAKWGTQWQTVLLGCRKAHQGNWRSLEEQLSVPEWKDTDPNTSEQEEDKEGGAGAAPRGTAQTQTSKCPEPGMEQGVRAHRDAVTPHPPPQHTASFPSTTLPPLPQPSSCQGDSKTGFQNAGNTQNRSEET